MNGLLLIDAVEAALATLCGRRRTGCVRPGTVTELLRISRPLKYGDLKSGAVEAVLREAFPLHRNRLKRRKRLKICEQWGRSFLKERGYSVRPLEDAKGGLLGYAMTGMQGRASSEEEDRLRLLAK